jgi:hypothetical protein
VVPSIKSLSRRQEKFPVRVIYDHDTIRLHFLHSTASAFDSADTVDHNDIEATVRELVDSRNVIIEEALSSISQLRFRAVFATVGAWDEAYICGGTPPSYLICPLTLGLDSGHGETAVRKPYSRAARSPLERISLCR